jgi:hypothetical protein
LVKLALRHADIYLAQLLLAIGAVKKPTSRATDGSSSGAQAMPDNYQESVSESLSTDADNLQAQTTDAPEDSDSSLHMLSALEKVCCINTTLIKFLT